MSVSFYSFSNYDYPHYHCLDPPNPGLAHHYCHYSCDSIKPIIRPQSH